MTIVFQWQEAEMQALLESCARDDAAPIIARHFPPGSRLLEAGCGAARWVRYLKDRGYDITGMELSTETVAMVNKHWPDLHVIQGDCERSPFPDASFDGVLSFGVVEHWNDGPQKPLRDILRVLKPGAKAYISVPCFNTIRRLKRALWWDELTQARKARREEKRTGRPRPLSRRNPAYLYPVFPAFGEFFEYRMSPVQFRAEVERAGFEVLEHVPVALLDGIYHELNPRERLVKWRDWKFKARRPAMWLNRWLSRFPFAHPHMQAIVGRKPERPAAS